LEDALALFNAATSTIAAFDAAYSLRAAAFAGRCALQLGTEWTPPQVLIERHSGSWILAELDCVEARRLIGLDPRRALALAEATLHRAQATDAVVASLYARATVAAALDKSGEEVGAKKLWLACWTEAMRIDDHLTLFDLFAVPSAVVRDCGPLALDGEFVDTVQGFNEERSGPNLAPVPRDVRTSTQAILGLSIAVAIGKPYDRGDVSAVARNAAVNLIALHFNADEFLSLSHSMSRMASVGVSWLLTPASRSTFRASFLATWDSLTAEIVAKMSH